MKAVVLDVETTGLKVGHHEIVQLSGFLPETSTQFDYKLRPFDCNNPDIYDPGAFAVNGLTVEEVKAFPAPEEVYKQFVSLLDSFVSRYNKQDKLFFIGYNCASFDWPFMYDFFARNRNKYFGSYFWFPSIDVCILAGEYLKNSRYMMSNFKLHTVAKFLGIEVDEARLHEASYDCFLTYEVYKIVRRKDEKI